MEKHIDVMKRAVELSETVLEGLEHVQTLLNEGKNEQTIILFTDILSAYSTISSSVKPVFQELKVDAPHVYEEELNKAGELVVSAYEEKKYGSVQELLQFNFIPRFKKYKEALETAFNPYLVS